MFERHRPTAATLISRLLDRREDVDDVLQEAAVQALVCLDRLRETARFGPWLCGTALNLARRQLRARARHARRPLGPAPPQSTEDLLVEAETAGKVRAAIATLPPGQREAVQLFYLDSLSEAEVAAELGIARSAVKSRLYKARRSLSGHLREERSTPVPQLSLIDVDVVDVRREPAFEPGASRTHVVVLRERGGPRTLPIFIGEPEGRAMVSNLTGLQTPRPMTYQMAASLVAALSGSVTEVRVVRLSENAFIAEVALEGPSGGKVVDARPSDAINLALLVGAPVRASEELLDSQRPATSRPTSTTSPTMPTPSEPSWTRSLSRPHWSALVRMPPNSSPWLARKPKAAATPASVPGTSSARCCARASLERPEALTCLWPPSRAPSTPRPSLAQPNPAPPLSSRSVRVLVRAGRRASLVPT